MILNDQPLWHAGESLEKNVEQEFNFHGKNISFDECSHPGLLFQSNFWKQSQEEYSLLQSTCGKIIYD